MGQRKPMSEHIVRKHQTGLRPTATELLTDRQGPLPVWVRGPKRGLELYTSCSRAKLYQWAAEGKIRSVSIRQPGRVRGCRLFHLGSILEFIERQSQEANL
jgi:hypothetical protein